MKPSENNAEKEKKTHSKTNFNIKLMKEFNLTEYLKNPSQKVITKDGRAVRIICTDYKRGQPIIALVTTNAKEDVHFFYKNGRWSNTNEWDLDLFFAPIKREGWINIYDITRINCISRIYKTKEEAETIGKGCKSGYITTIKIEWEE